MSIRDYTVDCVDHGRMTRNELRMTWDCPDGDCAAWLSDEEVYRLVSAAPADGPVPLPIVVT